MEAQTEKVADDTRFQDWEFEARYTVTFMVDRGASVPNLVDAFQQADTDFPWYYKGSDDQEWPASVVVGQTTTLADGSFVIEAHHPTRLTPARFHAYGAYLLKLCLHLQSMNLAGVRWINWDLALKSDPRGINGQAG